MIFGPPIKYDDRFGDNMCDFLSLVNSASATYKISKIGSNTNMANDSEIRFNFNLSIAHYSASLNSNYKNSISELESTLSETYNKFDKLFFIVKLLAELESFNRLLIKATDGLYSHKLFEFYNLSEDEKEKVYTETDFQEYYKWMDRYLKKMHSFVINIKEITEKTNQSDFVLPQSLLTDQNTSTKKNPLEYFEYLFNRQGLIQLKQDFIPSEEDCDLEGIYYDSKTETIYQQYVEKDNTEWEKPINNFNNFYHRRLFLEYQISCKHIDTYISSLRDEASITLFIKVIICKLKYLLSSIDINEEAKKYDSSKKPIDALILFFYKKYALFFTENMIDEIVKNDSIDNDISKIPQQTSLFTPENQTTTFKWKSQQEIPLSTTLHQELKDYNFIETETELDAINKAFSGIKLERPMKIKWTAKGKNNQINKHLLFYLLNELTDKQLIEDYGDNTTFKKRIRLVFCDSNGETIKNLNESNSTSTAQAINKMREKTPDEIKIDTIIVALKLIAAIE
jgi:hypothetical protein